VRRYAGTQRGYVSLHFRMKLLRKIVRGKWPPMAKPDSAIFEKLEVAQVLFINYYYFIFLKNII
jgi:hypothetical protein